MRRKEQDDAPSHLLVLVGIFFVHEQQEGPLAPRLQAGIFPIANRAPQQPHSSVCAIDDVVVALLAPTGRRRCSTTQQPKTNLQGVYATACPRRLLCFPASRAHRCLKVSPCLAVSVTASGGQSPPSSAPASPAYPPLAAHRMRPNGRQRRLSIVRSQHACSTSRAGHPSETRGSVAAPGSQPRARAPSWTSCAARRSQTPRRPSGVGQRRQWVGLSR